jgi:DNA-binding NarL/FixJ family response regulator
MSEPGSSETSTSENALSRTWTVILVDDHAIWRGGVRSMLEDTEFEVIGEASSGKEALNVVRETPPGLVLLDIRMAGGDGLDALQAIKKEFPRTAVVMLTTYDNPTYMARAVAGGAAGYLLKGVDRDDLLTALQAVANGETLLSSQELVRSLRGISAETSEYPDLVEPLTEREVEVLRLVATGLNNRDIATLLFVAESTVKTHVEHIIGKLGVSDRVQAAVWAARTGLVTETANVDTA